MYLRHLNAGIFLGWHLSFFTSAFDMVRKIESFSHRELDIDEYKNVSRILETVQRGEKLNF